MSRWKRKGEGRRDERKKERDRGNGKERKKV